MAVDLTRLAEAVKPVASVLQQSAQGCEEFDQGGAVLEASNALLDAPKVWWCVTHNAESVENHGYNTDECWRVVWLRPGEPGGVELGGPLCRMVKVAVVPVEE